MTVFALVAVASSTGCKEIEARRLVQKADVLYLEGNPDKAIPLYEEALAKKPDLVTAQHNAALAYYQMFKPGEEGEENVAYAKKATELFELYLQSEPKDSDIQKLLTQTWEDSGQVEAAIKFWMAKLEADPKNRDILNQLAAVNINAGRLKDGLAWLWKLADAESEDAGKLNAYLMIGRTAMGRLAKPTLVDDDRLSLADEGIAALQAAVELEPKNMQIHGLLNAIYQRRALAHGASWARLLDLAAARSHWTQYRKLEAELKKNSNKGKSEKDKAEKPEKK
ncbi:MAG: hypothetical protein KJO07_12865 [Deltaproteobacteria bacterium]|nr:hypothetical protein [Deltaproteobacteria bacterium]